MIYDVPCTPDGAALWTQRTALDGVDFVLGFDWQGRQGHWAFTLSDASGEPIRSGIILTSGAVLLRGVLDPRRPKGELIVLDLSGKGDVDPGFSDLGTRFAVVYLDASELGR